MKHTPGPWKINEWQNDPSGSCTYHGEKDGIEQYTGHGVQHQFRVVADKKHLVDSNTFGSFEGCHIADINITYDGREEALANARLMKSAPDLLEKAEALLTKIDHMTTEQFQCGGERKEREALRAIIAEARGKS